MKVLVISDIHGSGYYAEKIKEINEREKPEEIIILGRPILPWAKERIKSRIQPNESSANTKLNERKANSNKRKL